APSGSRPCTCCDPNRVPVHRACRAELRPDRRGVDGLDRNRTDQFVAKQPPPVRLSYPMRLVPNGSNAQPSDLPRSASRTHDVHHPGLVSELPPALTKSSSHVVVANVRHSRPGTRAWTAMPECHAP